MAGFGSRLLVWFFGSIFLSLGTLIGWIRVSIAHVVLWLDLFESQYIDASVYKIPRRKVDAVPWLEPFLSGAFSTVGILLPVVDAVPLPHGLCCGFSSSAKLHSWLLM